MSEEIKLKKAKTCSHCAAFLASMTGNHVCTLGYLTEKETKSVLWVKFNTWEDLFVRIKPAEPCPKPKNISECVDIRSKIDIHRYSTPGTPEYERVYGDSRDATEEESKIIYTRHKK